MGNCALSDTQQACAQVYYLGHMLPPEELPTYVSRTNELTITPGLGTFLILG